MLRNVVSAAKRQTSALVSGQARSFSLVMQAGENAPHTKITDIEHARDYPEYYKERTNWTLEDYTPAPGLHEHQILPTHYPDTRPGIYLALGASKAAYYGLSRAYVNMLVASLSASAEILAMGVVEVDISAFKIGTTTTVKWRGKPVFFKHRTPEEIAACKADDSAEMRDVQTDAERVKRENMLVVVGICTHLGCVPMIGAGDYDGGFFCPCHGSHYDASGRIRKGPAPTNLEVPAYKFLDDNTILVG